MTPDIEQIRAALAVEIGDPNWFHQRKVLRANAPVWLASLCDEIERLRTEEIRQGNAIMAATRRENQLRAYQHSQGETIALVQVEMDQLGAERDAALAECERLRAPWLTDPIGVAKAERDEWQACADQLAAADNTDQWLEALAVYETLKGADS